MLGLAAEYWPWLGWFLGYTSVRVVAAAMTAFLAMYFGMPVLDCLAAGTPPWRSRG